MEKYRSIVVFDGRKWEVDEFLGPNLGLVVAEVELKGEGQEVNLPPWVGRKVSHEARYRNAALARRPYAKWTSKARN